VPQHNDALVSVEDLSVEIDMRTGGTATVVDGVSLQLRAGDRLGVVGESGSGKTMLGLSLLQLLPAVAQISRGQIYLKGSPLVGLSEEALCQLRGRQVAMVFQDPTTGCDPLRRVGSLLTEAARRAGMGRSEAKSRAIECLRAVGIPAAQERFRSYPHQLSGGQRQRVMIALALVNSPSVIVADEPTTALDATIQAQILDLLRATSGERALILITHDLGVAAEVCERIVVMYAGRIMEAGPVRELMEEPRHPYTQGLLRCRPDLGVRIKRLQPIGGTPPRLGQVPKGCPFAPRCPRAQAQCETAPQLVRHGDREIACWYPG
jgi:oligopeptide/dipeptide ABC transporter ATP-binding protein